MRKEDDRAASEDGDPRRVEDNDGPARRRRQGPKTPRNAGAEESAAPLYGAEHSSKMSRMIVGSSGGHPDRHPLESGAPGSAAGSFGRDSMSASATAFFTGSRRVMLPSGTASTVRTCVRCEQSASVATVVDTAWPMLSGQRTTI
jgi:hypothetical protein